MSDKNRNMNDINDQKTAEQQAFSEEIRRRLAEPGSGKPTLDEFKVMVYKDREKRRKKRNTLVACLVAAFIVGFLTFDDLVPEVGADKNPKETIQTEDGVIIEDGGWGSLNEENGAWIINDWIEVLAAREHYPWLLIPNYIPNNYKFSYLKIETIISDNTVYEYCLLGKNDENIELEIHRTEGGVNTADVNNVIDKMEYERGTIFIQTDKKATIFTHDGSIINVWHSMSDTELLKLIEGLY